ncbi:16535_t:CDS:2 [Gigaspora margarita]|uniref:16535_t:CDS:1 n=1 Tax=Gigaspora margarita TaxID=4874 RepID=A0ABN7UY53_GIGMA|nr:16535_t:CDS:2 [Gigaspora margarita]
MSNVSPTLQASIAFFQSFLINPFFLQNLFQFEAFPYLWHFLKGGFDSAVHNVM